MSIYNTKTEQSVYFINFTENLNETHYEELKLATKTWLASTELIYVFDFSKVKSIDKTLFSVFVLFSRYLRKNNKFLYSIEATPELQKLFKDMGLDDIFNPVDDLKKIFGSTNKNPQVVTKIDAEFIKPFIYGVQQAFGVQANTPVTPEKPYAKKEKTQEDIAIAGVLNITSKSFKGTIALCFPKVVFLTMYKNMIGEDHPEIIPEIQDACGELLNILFGIAKAELNNKKGYEIEKAIPTVIAGHQMKILQTTPIPVIVLPFKTDAGYFYLEIVAG